MYIVKNALKCIGRSKGRNVLIGIIALVIALSACIGLSIRQAAESAKADTMESLMVTAAISFDRQSMMNDIGKGNRGEGGRFDRDQFIEMMGGASSLTLEEYKRYAEANSVSDFYYTVTASFNGSDVLEPVTTETDEDSNTPSFPNRGQGGGMMGNMANSGDFTVVGYSSDAAMTDFASGITVVSEGAVFEEATNDYVCIVSKELATYNDLAVNDVISLTNVNSETECYELTVVGIYSSTDTNEFSMATFGAGQDPANRIYMSADALQLILDASEESSETVTDTDSGREYETALKGSLTATYAFANVEDYYTFEKEVRSLGLDESYTVSSPDITAFESSLVPLNTLSTMAGWFLLVILIIGAAILVVLNIFNVRERKYEIGVLTAMGMKKGKVALQFMTEILVVMMVAIFVGAAVGAVSSVPVTNTLLAGQIESQQTQQTQMENNFGRPGNRDGDRGEMPDMGEGIGGRFGNMVQGAANYISEIDSAMNLTVVLQMLGIGLALTVIAGAVSVLFVMRYDPLRILSNRD